MRKVGKVFKNHDLHTEIQATLEPGKKEPLHKKRESPYRKKKTHIFQNPIAWVGNQVAWCVHQVQEQFDLLFILRNIQHYWTILHRRPSVWQVQQKKFKGQILIIKTIFREKIHNQIQEERQSPLQIIKKNMEYLQETPNDGATRKECTGGQSIPITGYCFWRVGNDRETKLFQFNSSISEELI